MSGSHPPLTSHRRLGPGAVRRQGSAAPYRSLQYTPGEPHLVREDLGGAGDPPVPEDGRRPGGRARPLASLVHITDLQLADVQSPARFEFLNRHYADPRYAELVPVQRPQEALTAHAIAATLATVSAARGPATEMAAQLAVTTGDAIDNTQWNELQNFLALLDGGPVRPDSGGRGYEGVQGPDWPDDIFWKPDGDGAGGPDIFRTAFGFPRHPGLLDRALREFTAAGLAMPWLSCFGNHEALIQGVGVPTPGLAAALVGGRKPAGLAENFDHDRAVALFTRHPEAYLAGPLRTVTADPDRRTITRQEFVAAHFRPGARPAGHGFTERNRLDGTAYYVHDTPAVRFIALDTNCLSGGADGCLDHDQARWLAERLAEVHSAHRAPDGSTVRSSHDDRLVVLFSHHGTDTLAGTQGGHAGPGGQPMLGGRELTALLHRFPNVVLWLNGHTHLNAVRARPAPGGAAGGFWEVTTCAVIDWPCQTRLVELTDCGDYLSVVCTMLDHDTPAMVTATQTSAEIASLHRELAANVPAGGADSGRAGTAADRNVDLRIRAPFPLSRLPGA
ncbi:MAG TPA: TIGR03767 family metallophosphoesterase [Streptosporangiaceae bacterium]|nr:TIGR03767 family metallophosphoesterase [Streptosporangiaceae bacterium]